MAREFDRFALNRRAFVSGAAALLVWPRGGFADHHEGESSGLADATRKALESAPYVYVSPLRADGKESTCHGEVWFGWIDGAVHLNTSAETWKARAIGKGLDGARIWVGDYGRWKSAVGSNNESFRQGPHFDAKAVRVTDSTVNDRLLAIYDEKYPEEIPRWRERMREGFGTGKRIVIRYQAA